MSRATDRDGLEIDQEVGKINTLQSFQAYCLEHDVTFNDLNFPLEKCLGVLAALPKSERAAVVEAIIHDGSMTWFVPMVELCLSWVEEDPGEWIDRRFVLGELSLQVAKAGRANMINYLMDDFPDDFDLSYTNFEAMPLLSVAALHSNHAVVKRLMHYKADINAVDPRTGYTALMYAAREGAYESVRALLADEAIDVVHSSSVDESTALTLSYLQTDMRIVCRIQAAVLMEKYYSLCDEKRLKSAGDCLHAWRELFEDIRDDEEISAEWVTEFFEALPSDIAAIGRRIFDENTGVVHQVKHSGLNKRCGAGTLFQLKPETVKAEATTEKAVISGLVVEGVKP